MTTQVVAQPARTPQKVDAYTERSFEWGLGSLFATPLNASYQHFNGSGLRYDMGAGFTSDEGDSGRSDENPLIHRVFERELAQAGATCRMRGQVEWCTGVETPEAA